MDRKSLRYGSIAAAIAVGVWAALTFVGTGGPGDGPVVSAPAAVEEPAAPLFDDLRVVGERVEPPALRVIEAPWPAEGTSGGA